MWPMRAVTAAALGLMALQTAVADEDWPSYNKTPTGEA